MRDYGVTRTQTQAELEELVSFAAETGCHRVVVSALKVPVGRWAQPDMKVLFRDLYGAPFGGKPRTRSFAWRLPEGYVKTLIDEVIAMGIRHGVAVTTCWNNLVTTL